MLLLRAGILEFLVLVHVIGAAVMFRRLFPRESPWLAFIAPALLVVTALNFIEHFVVLPDLGWILPFTLGGLIFAMARPGYWWEALRLPTILFVVVFSWALFIRCMSPAITADTGGAADMERLIDVSLGGKLPPIDSWCPHYDNGGYATFQHYGASILTRLFWLDVGSGYNVAYTLLNALTCLAGAGAAYTISGKKTWVAVATLVILLANFTGASVFLLYWDNALFKTNPYNIFDVKLATDIGIGWNDWSRHSPFAWIFHNPPPSLRLLPPAFYMYFADFNVNLGGQFLTLGSLLAANEAFRTERSNAAWICLMVFPLMAMVTAPWFFLVVAVLCIGGIKVALIAGKRPANFKMVVGGSVLGLVLLWPSINTLEAAANSVEFHWTPWLEYTAPWEFVIQWWPVIVPWIALCFIWDRLSLLARWIHAAVPLLLILCEVATFGDRGATTEANWGAIYGIGLATFLPLVFLQKGPGFRILTVSYLFIGAIFVLTWTIMSTNSVAANTAFHLKGDSVFQNDAQKKRLLQVLRQIHAKTVLSGKSAGADNPAPTLVGFSENRCYIASFAQEAQSGHSGEAEFRDQQSTDFFAGTMANPLAFLRSSDITAVMIWPDDAIPDGLLQKFKDELAADYYYVDFQGGGPNNAGVFLLNPGALPSELNAAPALK